MDTEESTLLKENGMSDEELKLIECPIAQIPKNFLSKALAAREHQLEIVEKLNIAWELAHPRKSYLESEDSTGILIKVDNSYNTLPAKPKGMDVV